MLFQCAKGDKQAFAGFKPLLNLGHGHLSQDHKTPMNGGSGE